MGRGNRLSYPNLGCRPRAYLDLKNLAAPPPTTPPRRSRRWPARPGSGHGNSSREAGVREGRGAGPPPAQLATQDRGAYPTGRTRCPTCARPADGGAVTRYVVAAAFSSWVASPSRPSPGPRPRGRSRWDTALPAPRGRLRGRRATSPVPRDVHAPSRVSDYNAAIPQQRDRA